MKKFWPFLNKSFREFNSRDVIEAHAQLSIKAADKLLFVLWGIVFTPLIAEDRLIVAIYGGLAVLCLVGFILLRNFGYSLLAELENGDTEF